MTISADQKNFPDRVILAEVGPRDGFQAEKRVLSTDTKVSVISGLVEAGLKEIQVASFVHPDRVPQMADAEAVVQRLPHVPDVVYTGLVLNVKGVERARNAGLESVEISISASDTHGRKNAGMPLSRAIGHAREMIVLAREHGLRVRASIQCAFGCVHEGEVRGGIIRDITAMYLENGVDTIALADTTGMADPHRLKKRVAEVFRMAGRTPVALHLHDTRGLGLVNLMAALECGVRRFDTSLGGMGGCPFVPGAAGNIPTQDTVYLLDTLGIATGIDLEKVVLLTERLEADLGRTLPARVRHQTMHCEGGEL